ncbi:hypothetical protein CRG98_025881 [Punica granatum]|uniref:Uncharacterized protein n=1 Tax=Punica granatum TaxID=22663 RepID=A0A2I0JBX4_PUNGR|nr:hypothetical protein CRG98_025881 [Punica granatum]
MGDSVNKINKNAKRVGLLREDWAGLDRTGLLEFGLGCSWAGLDGCRWAGPDDWAGPLLDRTDCWSGQARTVLVAPGIPWTGREYSSESELRESRGRVEGSARESVRARGGRKSWGVELWEELRVRLGIWAVGSTQNGLELRESGVRKRVCELWAKTNVRVEGGLGRGRAAGSWSESELRVFERIRELWVVISFERKCWS